MTAHELAQDLLEGPDLPVHFVYEYGDYWHTMVAPKVTSAEPQKVRHSQYHSLPKLVESEDEEGKEVIVLFS